MTSLAQMTVPFHGAELFLVEHEGQPYTSMKPIVEGMGLIWQSQHEKLKQRLTSTITEIVMVEMTCIAEITIQVFFANKIMFYMVFIKYS